MTSRLNINLEATNEFSTKRQTVVRHKWPKYGKKILELLEIYNQLGFKEFKEHLERIFDLEITKQDLSYTLRRLRDIGVIKAVPILLDMRSKVFLLIDENYSDKFAN